MWLRCSTLSRVTCVRSVQLLSLLDIEQYRAKAKRPHAPDGIYAFFFSEAEVQSGAIM